jgi:predicted O-linked N-acetylglucosamine transferase (SPINDLY family)
MQKITQPVFKSWMTILSNVPGSVLWLLSGTGDTNQRLVKAAEQCGIPAHRLIFAEKRPNPVHLARYSLADLFLDTFPYGAHTTAADSMWMGVPILTVPGRSFASRVCSSVVRAAGMDDFVCPTADVYVTRAIEFGRNSERMAAAKQKLAANRDTCLLFDTPRLVAALEDLYRQMWADFEAGNLPRPDLTNLEVYHSVGTELGLEGVGSLPDEAYAKRWQERLDLWNANYPLPRDGRMWAGAA